jgi:uncharacterized SAM-binding protein YcdF (DUF218 family)
MYFLAKLAQFLINPNTWLVALLVGFFISKKTTRKKRIGIVTIVSFLLLTNGALYKTVMHAWQPAPVKLTKTYSAGILLTGMAGFAPDGNGFFGESGDRFTQTLKLYNQGLIKKIIITGGDGSLSQQGPKEADFLYEQLLLNKVSPADIIIENQSRNTYENALNSKKITDSIQLAPPFVLITSAIHMPRSQRLFTRQGLPVVIYPCNYKVINNRISWDDFLPNFGIIEKWSFLFKEWLGILVYKISGKA